MRRVFILLFLLIVSVSYSQIHYQLITGDLLRHWNTADPSCFADVPISDFLRFPDGINEIVMTGIEVEQDSLDIYLLGISSNTDIPFLLATGGYRGEYNFDLFYMFYNAEDDELELRFSMPNCSRKNSGYYELDIENQSLVHLRYCTEDRSLDALERADSLMIEGDITGAIDELNHVSHDRYYYNPDEMIARLLRIVNRTALEEANAGNNQGAVDLFEYLSDYNRMSSQ